ncbi:hypothetical protein VULLAG_LOCUS4162 [Vulpes lagopus]
MQLQDGGGSTELACLLSDALLYLMAYHTCQVSSGSHVSPCGHWDWREVPLSGYSCGEASAVPLSNQSLLCLTSIPETGGPPCQSWDGIDQSPLSSDWRLSQQALLWVPAQHRMYSLPSPEPGARARRTPTGLVITAWLCL